MAAFMTRVELHDATYYDYESLHVAMEKEGFSRTIVSNQGATYNLPTAEYYRSSQLTIDQILASAERAAASTRKNYGVIVTESNGIRWNGLPVAG